MSRQELSRSRKIALSSMSRQNFMRDALASSRYLAGYQYPDWYINGEYEDKGVPWIILPIYQDFVLRLTAMLSAGRMKTIAKPKFPMPDELVQIARAEHLAWQEMVNFGSYVTTWVHDTISYGIGAVRAYVDPTEFLELGGKLALESIHPEQVWIEPTARDPYALLLGSKYVGYEYVDTRGDLAKTFPKKAEKIRRLPRLETIDSISSETPGIGDDPVRGFMNSVTDTILSERGGDKFRSAAMSGGENDSEFDEDDLIRVVEYQYREIESVPYVYGNDSFEIPVAKWYRCVLAGDPHDMEGETSVMLVDDEEIPYGAPTITLMKGWIDLTSPYSASMIRIMGDIQDLLNTSASMVANDMMRTARMSNILAGWKDLMDDDLIDAFTNGTPPGVALLNYVDGMSRDISHALQPLDQSNKDFERQFGVLDKIRKMASDVSGVHSPAIGDMELSRTSGIALGEAQQAIAGAMEMGRNHVDSSISHLANLGFSMIRHHWDAPHRTPAMGTQQPGAPVNATLPVNDQTTGMVNGIMAKGKYEDGGETVVPNAVIVGDINNEERVFSMDERDQAMAAMAEEETAYAEYGINYLPAVELSFNMTVEGDYKQKQQEALSLLTNIIKLKGNTAVSTKTLYNESFADDPSKDYAKEQSEVLGDQVASLLDKLRQESPEMMQQALQAIQQTMQAAEAQKQQPQQGKQGARPQQGGAPQQQRPSAMAQLAGPAPTA